ncbi:hypothetical protein FHS15_000504 [Paenibacillus castaneae]|uniref:transcription initiation factor TFIIIB n=1 Tax=Paenibacillus castaneae TaxID=474957 RepID=UPI001FBA675D|nr:transcription initiation factor TFIIIB [Paenibacillus castaneae]NIK75406.1 hypothetical protein [Paenibacillus castaneae]
MNECPKCHGSDFSKGVQNGYASIRPEKTGLFNSGSELVHVFCSDCGFIIESYVRRPEKFKPKK